MYSIDVKLAVKLQNFSELTKFYGNYQAYNFSIITLMTIKSKIPMSKIFPTLV